MEINYKELCLETCRVAKLAAAFIKQEAQHFDISRVEYKDVNNLVSYVDKTAEQMIIEELKKLLPEATFIAEESFKNEAQAKYEWIIDPLDGTTNFTHGIPCYCVSIALMEDDEIVTGVIYEVNLDECFYSYKNGPSFLNEKIISVSKNEVMKKSLIATGFPYTKFDRTGPYMQVFDYCMHHTHGLRRLGSACADLAYVACGRFEAFYEYGLAPWDVAAGVIIVKNAGGVVTDFHGGNNIIFGEELIASNKNIADEFGGVVKKLFGY